MRKALEGNIQLLKLDLFVAFGYAEDAGPNVGLVPDQLKAHLSQEVLLELCTSRRLVSRATATLVVRACLYLALCPVFVVLFV